jgi:hypothetical protein
MPKVEREVVVSGMEQTGLSIHPMAVTGSTLGSTLARCQMVAVAFHTAVIGSPMPPYGHGALRLVGYASYVFRLVRTSSDLL